MGLRFKQLGLLLWKNFVLQFRRPVGTFFELFIPLVCFAILLITKLLLEDTNVAHCFSTYPAEDYNESSRFSLPDYGPINTTGGPFPLGVENDPNNFNSEVALPPVLASKFPGLEAILQNFTGKPELLYWPQNSLTAQLMIRASLTLGNPLSTRNFTSSEELLKTAAEDSSTYYGVVVFNVSEDVTTLPMSVEYSIRISANLVVYESWLTLVEYPIFAQPGPFAYNMYESARFLDLQNAVDQAIAEYQTENGGFDSGTYKITRLLQRLPYPEWTLDVFTPTIAFMMPFLMCISFIYSSAMITKEIVLEKELKLKESMKMMGLANWLHWLAWFLKSFTCLVVSVLLIVILLKAGGIFPYTDGTVLFVVLTFYAFAVVMWSFLVSVFFSKAKTSMSGAIIAFYINYVVVEFILLKYSFISSGKKVATCLLQNACVGLAMQIVSEYESQYVGLQWNNIYRPPTVDRDLSMIAILGMFLVDAVLYGLITWYIEAVFPGDYGVPRKFYFPFQRSYWMGNKIHSDDQLDEKDMADSLKDFEPDPKGINAGIKIKNLRKLYKSSVGDKLAVENLSLSMYENQITALLGHNGAGKTTTMSILVGLFPPTAGTAFVNGYSILTEIDDVRESLGLCPQHNVLFDRLTVKEHLKFFINLKGVYGKSAEEQVLIMIKDLQLIDKTHCKSAALSGGMKRKLSCAIALVGESKIVILDEPTSGMDPSARRATWDLLLKHKKGRTILLTTHSMDEADLLGDRIAIMGDGKLMCCGSSLFLKNRYGIGYHMTLVKSQSCDVRELTGCIQRYVPGVQLTEDVGLELTYLLPRENSDGFPMLFKDLEENRLKYGVDSFGVSVTTMEEVFMKAGEDNTGSQNKLNNGNFSPSRNGSAEIPTGSITPSNSTAKLAKSFFSTTPGDAVFESKQEDLLSGFSLKWQQYRAIFIKRLIHSKRDIKAVLTQLLMPLIFVLFGLLIIALAPDVSGGDPPRIMTFENLTSTSSSKLTQARFVEALYADFRTGNNEPNVLEHLPGYLASFDIYMKNVTEESLNIKENNAGNLIKGKERETIEDCCNYNYFILNNYCAKILYNESLEQNGVHSCRDVKTFGYYYCPSCLLEEEAVNNCEFGEYNDDNVECLCPSGASQEKLVDPITYFQEYILRDSESDAFYYDHPAAFTVDREGDTILVTGWWSNEGYHIAAETMAAIDNVLLWHSTNKSYVITVTNDPLPASASDQIESESEDALLLASSVSFGLSFLAASFVPFLIQERASKAKHVQFVSGVDPASYWFGTITWDILNYIVVMVVVVILFAAFDTSYRNVIGSVVLLMLLFGWASIPFSYSASFMFKSPLDGYGVIALLLGLTSFITLVVIYVLGLFDHLVTQAQICDYVFMLLPTHALGRAMTFLSTNDITRVRCTSSELDRAICMSQNITWVDSAFDWVQPGIGQHCSYLFLEGIFFFTLTLLIEVNFFVPAHSAKYLKGTKHYKEDEDVAAERQRVKSLNPKCSEDAVILQNLTKIYTGGPLSCKAVPDPAVEELCLGIPSGQCFGLLGVNGAGKTTTFGMLTGDLSITAGTAYMNGYNIQSQRREVQQRIGYCPQFDALVEKLTGRELLRMFARLRGIPSNQIEKVVSSAIENLSLNEYADKMCETYSGGNKRKLSTAIAIVGNPPIVFLDEPTAGMDPKAKRFLWNALTKIMQGGRSIVLTSHSMEECEALCTRLAIMVNGKFKCLGSIQHLKSRFGKGYTLMIKVRENSKITALKLFVEENFSDTQLVEEHQVMLHYQVNDAQLSWSFIFGLLELNKTKLHIVDYSISQTTLEQIFINFAKEQHNKDIDTEQNMSSLNLADAAAENATSQMAQVSKEEVPGEFVNQAFTLESEIKTTTL